MQSSWLEIKINLFSLGSLLPHFGPCEKTLENFCFQIFIFKFSFSHMYMNVSFFIIFLKEKFSRKSYVVCNKKIMYPS